MNNSPNTSLESNNIFSNPFRLAITLILASILYNDDCEAIKSKGEYIPLNACTEVDKNCFEARNLSSFKENIPSEVLDSLKEFDSEKFEMLSDILLLDLSGYISYGSKSAQATYYGKAGFNEKGALQIGINPEYHLVSLSKLENASNFELALFIVHELYGHAFDNIGGELDEFNDVNGDCEDNLYKDKIKVSLRSEFISFYVMFKYMCMIESKLDFWGSVDYFDMQDYLRKFQKFKDLYNRYKESIISGDWTYFKEGILDIYFNVFKMMDFESESCDSYCIGDIREELLTPEEPTYRFENKHLDSPETKAWFYNQE